MTHPVDQARQIACIRVPNFCWQVEGDRNPALPEDRPVLITCSMLDLSETDFFVGQTFQDRTGLSERVVLDSSPCLGDVQRGMPVDVALSRHSDALLTQADTPLYLSVFEELVSRIEQLIPAVEVASPGFAYVDLNGLDRLYGTSDLIVRRLAEVAGNFDLRIGIGENKWQAILASTVSKSRSAARITGDPANFVGKFPVDSLPAPYPMIHQLHSFGLHRLSDVAAIPQGSVEAQFGLDGRVIWQLANGIHNYPLLPRKVADSVIEFFEFPDITASMLAVISGVESLLGRAFNRPQMQGRYARKVRLQAQVFQKPPWSIDIAFKEPVGSKNRALFSIKSKLAETEFPGALEDIRLTLTDLSGESWKQESMWKEVQREDNLQQAMSQLAVRIGTEPPIYQVRELEPWSRIPERRHALVQLSQ